MFARNRIARVLAAFTVIGAASLAGAQIASAGNPPKTYTACLSSQGGISKVKVGSSPTSPCTQNQQQITLGDGTAATSQLPAGCATGQVAKAYASWSCAPDLGGYENKVGPVSVTAAPGGSNCPDGSVFSGIATHAVDTKQAKISFPTGTYRPMPWGDFHYSIDKIADPYGDNWTGGFGRIEIVRVRNGVETTASQWVRTKSQNLDNGLPYEREFTPFVAFAGDMYYLRATASADECAVTNLLNIEVAFDRIS